MVSFFTTMIAGRLISPVVTVPSASVIVSDLAEDGALVVQRPPTQPTYTSLLEKVLAVSG